MISLQSGSAGNCIFVETNGVRLVFDAGISGRQFSQRLDRHGYDPNCVDALLISHNHHDHMRCMGVFHRKFGCPVFLSQGTWSAVSGRNIGRIDRIELFESGSTLTFGEVQVHTIRTPHDGVDGVAFVVDDGRHRLGILTDLGHAFDGLEGLLETLDAVLLESNYDPELLAAGPYPDPLKQRIRGAGGHLSNRESAELLAKAADGRLRWACLGHLSEQNNTPILALKTHREVLGSRLPLLVADRYEDSCRIDL
jgi:phosphoribosyl 1,2-cyclic phosphodiesterase